MENFQSLFMTVYGFMRDTTILSFSIGGASVELTFLHLLIGTAVASIGIDVLHHIFDW